MTIKVGGSKVVIEGTIPKIARIEQEWCDDVDDPEGLAKDLRKIKPKADILTFCQRFSEIKAKHDYYSETDSIAALPISNYSFWFEKQIDPAARNKIRKAQKKGLSVKMASFTDEFVHGMTLIFNETPIRQGRRFLHYGKDFQTVKDQFSRFLFREELFGAYFENELVGFIMLADAGRYAFLGQIISTIARRDLAPNNALLAKAVERCAEKGVHHLVYASWLDDGLGDFKRSNGFKKFDIPRYFVPLTLTGKLALNLGLQRGWKSALPEQVIHPLKKLRTVWYNWKGSALPSCKNLTPNGTC